MTKIKNRMFATGQGVLIPLFALLLLGAVGIHCEDDVCDVSDADKCDGDYLVSCFHDDYSEGAVRSQVDCSPGTCVEPDSEEYAVSALCVDSDEQNQACLDNPDQSAVCDGSRYLYCYAGYVREFVEECTSPDHCVIEEDGYSGCVETVGKDPRCPNLSYAVLCDGAELFKCEYGYLTESVDCTSEELCYGSERTSTGGCILSDVPDSRCEELIANAEPLVAGMRTGCDGEVVFACLDEYLVSEVDCETNGGACFDGACREPTKYIPPSDDGCRAAPAGTSHRMTVLGTLLQVWL
jgi:hypothetical protein